MKQMVELHTPPLEATAWSSDRASDPALAVSVVICAYTLDRWTDLQRAVGSVLLQQPPVKEVVVVVDHNPELLARACARWPAGSRSAGERPGPEVLVVPSQGEIGLSGARNTGVEASSSEIVAFLDDDAVADEGWVRNLAKHYSDPEVAACGGVAAAAPVGTRPIWWPVEFDWVVGCSYRGLPARAAVVRNLIGASMSVRRSLLLELGGFAEGIGRVGCRPVGCEETDFFIRLTQRWPQTRILYEPTALVRHTVPVARLSWRYFRARCFAEGLSKASVAARVGSRSALTSERTYALKVLPASFARALGAACRGEEGAALRAGAIAAGLMLTTSGYVWGSVTTSLKKATVVRPSKTVQQRVMSLLAPWTCGEGPTQRLVGRPVACRASSGPQRHGREP